MIPPTSLKSSVAADQILGNVQNRWLKKTLIHNFHGEHLAKEGDSRKTIPFFSQWKTEVRVTGPWSRVFFFTGARRTGSALAPLLRARLARAATLLGVVVVVAVSIALGVCHSRNLPE